LYLPEKDQMIFNYVPIGKTSEFTQGLLSFSQHLMHSNTTQTFDKVRLL